MAQVALAWLRDRPAVSSVIVGTRTTEHLEDNLGADVVRLDRADVALLDKAGDPDAADYLYGGPGREQRSRKIEGGR